MLSAVYQQSSDPPSAAVRSGQGLDPENRLLWRMNKQRLDFEGLRDSLLALSGELDFTPGGKPVELFGKKPSLRRAVYGYVDRQFLPGVLRTFDFANPDLHIPQRSDTTVPQQALFFLNSGFVAERARALAGRPEVTRAAKAVDRVRALYRIAYQREPTRKQLAAALDFIQDAEAAPPPPPPKPLVTAWQYGYGAYDDAAKRITNFTPLPHFTGEAWQGGEKYPDDKLGWVQLTAEGGHAGNDLQHAAIRRWVAPGDAVVNISGALKHEHKEGDGIVARIISSRGGLLGAWTLHNFSTNAAIERAEVKAGDTLDFLIDFRANLNSDDFKWAPVVKLASPASAGDPTEWSAKREFGGPPAPPVPHLTPWEQYAQVLLLANELMFVD